MFEGARALPSLRPEWVGKEAPDFELRDLNGREVSLSAMHGKIVVLDFWATWCVPCIEEMPIVEKITKYSDKIKKAQQLPDDD